MVQIRRNDSNTRVGNRAPWVVKKSREDEIILENTAQFGDTRTVACEYGTEHLLLV